MEVNSIRLTGDVEEVKISGQPRLVEIARFINIAMLAMAKKLEVETQFDLDLSTKKHDITYVISNPRKDTKHIYRAKYDRCNFAPSIAKAPQSQQQVYRAKYDRRDIWRREVNDSN